MVLDGTGAQQLAMTQAANVDLGDGPGTVTLAAALTASGTVRSSRTTTVSGGSLSCTTLEIGAGFSTTTPGNFSATTCVDTELPGACTSLGL